MVDGFGKAFASPTFFPGRSLSLKSDHSFKKLFVIIGLEVVLFLLFDDSSFLEMLFDGGVVEVASEIGVFECIVGG